MVYSFLTERGDSNQADSGAIFQIPYKQQNRNRSHRLLKVSAINFKQAVNNPNNNTLSIIRSEPLGCAPSD